MKYYYKVLFLTIILVLLSACNSGSGQLGITSPTPTFSISQTTTILPLHPAKTSTPTPILVAGTDTTTPTLRFAVIGDYGEGSSAEKDVADLIISWTPDLIITTGDNNYPDGNAEMIDQHIGQYYHAFIFPYQGDYGDGASENRFFPSLGNHDWITEKAQPYLDYFNLPGNERYYQFSLGPVNFFVLDSDAHEPDGVNASSMQADWLKQGLSDSTSAWNIVYFHHPPYSSGLHGSTTWMRWPFKEWGVDLVLSGHDHAYERLQVNDLTYIVNGLGGASIYDFILPLPGSLVRYNQDYGAILIDASSEKLHLQFINRSGVVIDDAIMTTIP